MEIPTQLFGLIGLAMVSFYCGNNWQIDYLPHKPLNKFFYKSANNTLTSQ